MVEHQSLPLPVFRHERDAFFDCLGRPSHMLGSAAEAKLAGFNRTEREDCLENLGAPAADQAGKAVDFPCPQREVDATQAVVGDSGQSEKLARGCGRAIWALPLVVLGLLRLSFRLLWPDDCRVQRP